MERGGAAGASSDSFVSQDDLTVWANENALPCGKEIGLGLVAGYTSGVALRTAGKIAGVVVGGAFIFLQSLAYSGYIQVDWQKIERGYKSMLDIDEDGEVTTNDLKIALDKIKAVLMWNLPSGAGFTGGLYYGMGGSAASAGKLGMGLGLGSVLMRGALVTSAPVVLTLAGENEGVKHQLDAGLSAGRKYLSSMTGDRNPGWLQGLIGRIQPTTEQQLENFRMGLEGRDLQALRKLEEDLAARLKSASGGGEELVQEQLNALRGKKQEIKAQIKKGWFW